MREDYSLVLKESFENWYAGNRDSWSTEMEMRDFLQFVDFEEGPSRKVLDIGAGRGADACVIAEKGHTVVALDLCQLQEWREIEEKYRGKIQFVSENILVWSSSECYDVIIDNGCFHHQQDSNVIPYLSKIRSLMNSGGVFALNVFSSQDDREIILKDGRIVRIYRENSIVNLLEKNSFFVQKSRYIRRQSQLFPFDYCYVVASVRG